MINLLMFFIVGLSGFLAFTTWALVVLFKKHRIKKRKIRMMFHYKDESGKTAIKEVESDYKDYFNFSKKDLKGAREYVEKSIENGKLILGTTLEQSNELIEKERKKDEQERENSKTQDPS